MFVSGETAQKLAYSLSYIAMIEFSYHVIGIGSSFSSMDLTALTLAQMKKTLEDIKKMVKIILSTPLKTAGKKVLTAMNCLENKQVAEAVMEFREAKKDAQTAYEYAKGQGKSLENLKQVETAFQIIVLAKVCILSYDEESKTMEPFYVLDDDKQRTIANELERDCHDFLEYHASVKVGVFSLNKDTKNFELKSMKNKILKCLYPYISEGKKYTCANKELPMSFEIECDPTLMPDEKKDATLLILGFRGYERKKVTELFYKNRDGDVVSYKSSEEIGFYGTSKSKNKIRLGPFKYFVIYPDDLGLTKFLQTTDHETIFFAEFLKSCWKIPSPGQFVEHDSFRDGVFFLYRSSGNAWCCSPNVGRTDDDPKCMLRNIPRESTEELGEMPPLSGWEYFSKDGEWVKYEDSFPADCFNTFDSVDVKDFTSKPWAALDRSKFKDEIFITASAEWIETEFIYRFASLCLGFYAVYKETQHKHSCVYKLTGGNWFIYKTEEGRWGIDDSVGDNNPMVYNDSSPHSEWPPETGWKLRHKALPSPFRVFIKINPLEK